MPKPIVLIVGGAWHTADYLAPLATSFEESGFPDTTLGLPSVGASPPEVDFSADVAAIRKTATTLIAEGKDVIAVLHSLSGIMGTEALHGLGKTASGGGGPGLVSITYIASMVPKKDHCFGDHVEACGDQNWKGARQRFTQDGLLALPPAVAQAMFYNDVEEDQAKHWATFLKPQSVGVYDSPLTHETYREVPSGYVLTSSDNAFKHEYQLKTVEFAGFPEDRKLTLEAGHTPWLSQPQGVKQFVLKIAHQS